MANDSTDTQALITDIEDRLLIRQKRDAAAAGKELAAARQRVLSLPDRREASELSAVISQLAGRENVIVEWRARDFDPTTSAAVACCCCCCCCL